jgi:hypothetical protein
MCDWIGQGLDYYDPVELRPFQMITALHTFLCAQDCSFFD